jgi:HEAT repeat protein
LLNSAEDKEFDAKALPGGLSLDADLTKRTSQLERLRAMVTNENFDARLAAVKTLARSRELDNVPALIYALSDPDWRVVEAARDGLAFISRKFQGYGPPPQATVEQVQAAQAKWKQWYLAIRPDGQLMD